MNLKMTFDNLKCLNTRIRLIGFLLLLSGCDAQFAFQDLKSTCEPPQTSARYGKYAGPVITSPAAHQPFNSKMKVSGTCVSGLPVLFRGSGVTETLTASCDDGQFSLDVTFKTGDGVKELDVLQQDSAGTEIVDRQCFDQDTIAPKVVISAGHSGAQAVGSRTIRLEGECESNLTVIIEGPQLNAPVTTQCQRGRFSADITFSGADGIKDVVARQEDRAGNRGQDDQQYKTDTVAPLVTITSPAPLSTSRGNVVITGTCESGLRVLIQGDLQNRVSAVDCVSGNYTAPITLSPNDGVKNIEVSQTDVAGNIGRAERDLNKDASAPMIRITAPQPRTISTGSLSISGVCESGLTVVLSGNGLTTAVNTTCTGASFLQNVTLSSPDGEKNIVATQTDAMGNVGSDNRTFILDSATPKVSITSPAANSIWQNTILLQGTCDNKWPVKISGAGHSHPGATQCKSGSYSVEVTFSSGDGEKNIIVTQKADNGNSSTDNRTFIKDTTAPAVAFTSPAANTPSVGGLLVRGTCETGLTVVLSGGIVTPNTTTCANSVFATNIVFSTGLGVKNVMAKQTDAAGNIGSANRNFISGNNIAIETFTSNGPGGKVDILFVDDNSASMDAEQAALGSKFSAFTSTLSSLDWQAGIITTDCAEGSPYDFCGQLHNFAGRPGEEYILTAKTPQYQTVFRNTIQRPETLDCLMKGSCPSGREEGLKSTIQSFKLKDSDNAGFFRADSDLAIIYLTDEDEGSNAPANATTPTQVLSEFRSIFGNSKRLSVHGIIVKPGDVACWNAQREQLGNNANYGTFFDQFAKMTDGLSVSICAPDYSQTLREIGENVTRLGKSIELTRAPIPSSVRVQFTPSHTTTWSLNGKRLTFDKPAPEGTQIEVSYEYTP